jgi:hypothetical protein
MPTKKELDLDRHSKIVQIEVKLDIILTLLEELLSKKAKEK